MKDRIDEFISGRPGRQFYDMDEQMQAVSAFAKIYGVGESYIPLILNSHLTAGRPFCNE
jgi:hypothetical protein